MVVCELFCPIKEILSPASNVRSGILFARLELDVDDGLFTRLQLLSPKQHILAICLCPIPTSFFP
jgi:hypothetical protein